MTDSEILQTAMRQSAIDSGASPADFVSKRNKTVISKPSPDARKYLSLPFECDLTSYGSNIVASVSQRLYDTVSEYIGKFSEPFRCFETPALNLLSDSLRPFGLRVCFMAEYFLPRLDLLRPLSCAYELRRLSPPQFRGLYLPQWSNALCRERAELDVLAFGAYDRGELIGLAGASADCADMWQIGVDVLPHYRNRGVASALTAALALEIIRRGKVPFYCCAWSNILSAKTALRSGFRPAWVQVTAKSDAFAAELIGGMRGDK